MKRAVLLAAVVVLAVGGVRAADDAAVAGEVDGAAPSGAGRAQDTDDPISTRTKVRTATTGIGTRGRLASAPRHRSLRSIARVDHPQMRTR